MKKDGTNPQIQNEKASPHNTIKKKSTLPPTGFAQEIVQNSQEPGPKRIEQSPAPKKKKSIEKQGSSARTTLFSADRDSDSKTLSAEQRDRAYDETGRVTTTPNNTQTHLVRFGKKLIKRKENVRKLAAREDVQTWVTFGMIGAYFGFPVTYVQEILRVDNISHIPHSPYPILGVIKLRGEILPVVDLRQRLGLGEATIDDQSRILVISSKGRLFGFLVDFVNQVAHLVSAQIELPPEDVLTEQSSYITGVYPLDESYLILLDVDKVLLLHDPTTVNEIN